MIVLQHSKEKENVERIVSNLRMSTKVDHKIIKDKKLMIGFD